MTTHSIPPHEAVSEQFINLIELLIAIARLIRTAKSSPLGGVPSGHLYAELMASSGMTLELYTKLINKLKATSYISETPAHLLVWTGPTPEASNN